MIRMCDTGYRECPQRPQCTLDCHFTTAELEPEVVRKIKPYPAIPDDIVPVPETWQMIGSALFGFAIAVLIVFFVLMFFTGVWMWSLLT